MLVLNRKVGESIMIGDDPQVEVKVLGIEEREGKQVVRLGFEAPKSVPIHRQEVHDRRQAARLLTSPGVVPGAPPARLQTVS